MTIDLGAIAVQLSVERLRHGQVLQLHHKQPDDSDRNILYLDFPLPMFNVYADALSDVYLQHLALAVELLSVGVVE